MIDREAGLVEIKERIRLDKDVLGIISFKDTPTSPAEMSELPCVFMLEGPDKIHEYSSRKGLGYPAKRSLEIVLELVVNKRTTPDIKTLFQNLRKTVFKVKGSDPAIYNNRISSSTFFVENRTEGPIGYGLPDIKVMRLILDLHYLDGGF